MINKTRPQLLLKTDVLEIRDIGKDAIRAGQLGGAERRRLGGFRPGKIRWRVGSNGNHRHLITLSGSH
jgi:hypothetical protein